MYVFFIVIYFILCFLFKYQISFIINSRWIYLNLTINIYFFVYLLFFIFIYSLASRLHFTFYLKLRNVYHSSFQLEAVLPSFPNK
ncbi:unnamed protein product [Meloidogyne enterolobii]|uniref:Uncharacterized protein n=1 Tax=Meloidogyne enterolobii TaxID=390850 RepID=A0ACB0ZQQ7_MELEN